MSATYRMGKAERKIRDLLRDTGLPWDMIRAKKHWMLYLCGEMIGVLSCGNGVGEADRGTRNLESCIKRIAEANKKC